ncbi:MAG: ribosome-associated translation inhibitor RaiA [Myxococcales bacterium FL481]|nr:MAG: ribosome-associated translation inhibitor RaiA [Myxococcales bacterium FL481]
MSNSTCFRARNAASYFDRNQIEIMQAQFIFRHMESSDALRNYAEERLSKIGRYFADPLKISCTLGVEKFSHVAQFDITLRNGLQLHSSETTESMYSSIDMALAKMERQVRRYKDRMRDHKPHKGRVNRVRQAVFSPESFAAFEPEAVAPPPPTPAPTEPKPAPEARPKVVRSREFRAERLSVDQAAMQMDLLHKAFYVFTNADTGDINVIYRLDTGEYGLLETQGHVDDDA